jgi:hypothetical protein
MPPTRREGRRNPSSTGAAVRLRWWRELLYILAFYTVYTLIRNTQGSAAVSAAEAFANARHVIRWEELLGTFHEATVQQAFLGARWFISFWNVFYGTAHFVVTIAALVLLFRRVPQRYPLWRNTLAFTTALALIGFATFPLMPPRLLPPDYGFVDTLRVVGGLWSFDSGAMQKVSNQYAAMPSLHFGWAAWSTLVLYPMAKQAWVRVLVASYPALTLFAIVVTANHYWLDAVGGAAVLGVGFLLGRALTRYLEDRVPAVDDESVAGVVGRRPAGEVDGDAAEVVGRAPAPSGDAA